MGSTIGAQSGGRAGTRTPDLLRVKEVLFVGGRVKRSGIQELIPGSPGGFPPHERHRGIG
jgi:hypothetical protein